MIDEQKEKNPTIRDAIEIILTQLGENPEREGLKATPIRVEKMYRETCSGYQQNLKEIVNGAVFHEKSNGMVLVKDIEFYSLCEHHMLPFFGMVHVAYLPDEKIIGLSKIPRIVDMYARRLQVQERLTTQIMEAIEEILQPKGCGVLIEASHLCAMMRGVKKDQAKLITTNFSGLFLKDESIRSDFVNQVNQESVKV
ncbi:MAG TPA: GTP cyclohydrolase I FolE [Flexilinea sp.]|jgi:GTP cyclohydrolase I|nr:GTP cyclohydrolase I FolE [Flexilinea sp.]OQA28405.1 MAG: GTP cyclohydrolase 1 [Chloroflexi bacterium ADurb.Bin344]HPB39633.1 GTP cyclohydrolase I FolE [Flexilinea sp.]HPJ64150.1 GTP cyclohydrolase I FolE [Flexilinea sp.]HPR71011.1 GTP cyclohydrolase I FolE [Flexilinea sp.]